MQRKQLRRNCKELLGSEESVSSRWNCNGSYCGQHRNLVCPKEGITGYLILYPLGSEIALVTVWKEIG